MTLEDLSRLQFALTAMFHIMFPAANAYFANAVTKPCAKPSKKTSWNQAGSLTIF